MCCAPSNGFLLPYLSDHFVLEIDRPWKELKEVLDPIPMSLGTGKTIWRHDESVIPIICVLFFPFFRLDCLVCLAVWLYVRCTCFLGENQKNRTFINNSFVKTNLLVPSFFPVHLSTLHLPLLLLLLSSSLFVLNLIGRTMYGQPCSAFVVAVSLLTTMPWWHWPTLILARIHRCRSSSSSSCHDCCDSGNWYWNEVTAVE